MQTQLDATRKQIILLAKRQRGAKSREEFFGEFDGISFNTYANFEAGSAWPRHRSLAHIETLLGWREGIIEEIESAQIEPATLTLAHMRGELPLADGASSLADYPLDDILAEVRRRYAEADKYRLAASRGGDDDIKPGDLPDS